MYISPSIVSRVKSSQVQFTTETLCQTEGKTLIRFFKRTCLNKLWQIFSVAFLSHFFFGIFLYLYINFHGANGKQKFNFNLLRNFRFHFLFLFIFFGLFFFGRVINCVPFTLWLWHIIFALVCAY